MMEREMITVIVDTLPVFYYKKMVGYTPSGFADLVFVDERIEMGLRRDKFDYLALMNRKPGGNGENKKEEGTHAVTAIPTWPNFPPAQQYHTQPISALLITHYHTLISFGDDHWPTFGFLLTELSCLTLIAA